MRRFGKLVFDGVDITDYGLTISGEGTYDAPERDETRFEIPGRNGDIVVDNGRYKNITVKYPVNIERDFSEKIGALRSFLMSHKGYFRMEDSYHPDEYRMARYAGPLTFDEVGPLSKWATFELIFDCMPQRFLKSGEKEIELNFTDNPTGGTAWDGYSDLDADAQAQVDDLGLMDLSVIFPKFTLTRNAEYVTLKSPVNKYRWIYPNHHILTNEDYDYCVNPSDLVTGSTFHAAGTTSPFLTVYDDQGEIYTPSYFGTQICNPTRFASKPIIKVYFSDDVHMGTIYFDTAFGVNADNYIRYRAYTDPNMGFRSKREIFVDCDAMDAYSMDFLDSRVINHNGAVTFVGQLELPPGEFVFRVSNLRADFEHVDKITLIPRWYTI